MVGKGGFPEDGLDDGNTCTHLVEDVNNPMSTDTDDGIELLFVNCVTVCFVTQLDY
jgi:hypothetical protein